MRPNSDRIAEVVVLATTRTRDGDTALSEFVEAYLADVPPDDLAHRKPVDLLGAALSHLELGRERAPGTAKVKISTPDLDADGWQCPHSIVDIVVDDSPFLLDSVTSELHRQGCGIHLVVHPILKIKRDEHGRFVEVFNHPSGGVGTTVGAEAWMHLEIDRQSDPAARAELQAGIVRVLADVKVAVEDWRPMIQRANDLADDISARLVPAGAEDASEVAALLRWFADGHFIFLGYREADFVEAADGTLEVQAVPDTGLGLLRDDHPGHDRHISPTTQAALRRRMYESRLLRISLSGARSTVFRPDEYMHVAIGRYDGAGKFIGVHRMIGLLTATAYRTDAEDVPVVRRRIAAVLDAAGYPLHSHSGRELRTILSTYPRDELFQIDTHELDAITNGVLDLQERKQVRLFPRWDPDGWFVSCLVYLPRDRYSTGVVERIERVLLDAFGGVDVEHEAFMSESVLARLHVIVRLTGQDEPPPPSERPDVHEIEMKMAAVTRWWVDDLRSALVDEFGEELGLAFVRRYGEALPVSYREVNDAPAAVADIRRLAALSSDDGFATALYRPPGSAPDEVRLKLYTLGEPVTLTRVLPLLEHMGVEVVDERPFEVRPEGTPPVWVYDIGLRVASDSMLAGGGGLATDTGLASEATRDEFRRVFAAAWRGEAESDGLNRLVLLAGLTGQQVQILRAYTRYLRQMGTLYSPAYVEDTLARHPDIVRGVIALFEQRFEPARQAAGTEASAAEAAAMTAEINERLDKVSSLDEDRILRLGLLMVEATTRTNVYRPERGQGARPVIAFKLDPAKVPDLPLPRPKFEIWVHSPWVEGVHLRGGPVARGGLRWSDRREDVRTEVLGLMKAQMVKNAVIVPVGAKGGFVVRRQPADAEALRSEVRECYRSFVAGLLDVTDNIVGGHVLPPPGVIRHDDDDPYLVVAADKGTATFSDLANEVAAAYNFWLGDAFASGGSAGYDHKAMGITARGAWCSVERHFRTVGIDVATTPITVVGIGDMSGDVFGNGMLLSPHLALVAAFDHRHVFIDPDPDPAASFAERRRLFDLPRSSWDDYDRSLVSAGGGVWPRSAKAIPVSDEARRALDIEASALTPTELISHILKAPVDLLWNGGIGTYVKASFERNHDCGDRANDGLRVDGAELRCRVVGEGGNLGFTQNGRVEFAGKGGLINTDAIDNSAGVDCSDHEVNIKIALGGAVEAGDLTVKQRNEILASMTGDVAEMVLDNNRAQNLALAMARAQAAPMVDVHSRMIRALEMEGLISRAIEHLPTEKQLAERQAAGDGLTTPEFAVLLAYQKTIGTGELVASDLPDDPWLEPVLLDYFPPAMRERFADQVHGHRLRREVVATQVVNEVVNVAGTSFCYRMIAETGASLPDIARAHIAASHIYGQRRFRDEIEQLQDRIDSDTELALLLDLRRMVERAVQWLLRHRRPPLDLGSTVAAFQPDIEVLATEMLELVSGPDHDAAFERVKSYVEAGVPDDLARRAAIWPMLHAGLDMVEIAGARGRTPADVAATYLDIVERLDLVWLSNRIGALPRNDRWQSHARAALRDDLLAELRELTADVLRGGDVFAPPAELVDRWVEHNERAVNRVRRVYAEIRSGGTFDLTTLSVALRQLRNLLLASQPAV